MGSAFAIVVLQDVWAMLEHCAPGYQRQLKLHRWWVMYAGKTYRALPLGEHGARKASQTEIEMGHVRKLMRFFGIEECGKAYFK